MSDASDPIRDLADALRREEERPHLAPDPATDVWTYTIRVLPADRSLPYDLTVYRNGSNQGGTYTTTKWGARLAARRLRRRFYKRLRLTPEEGTL